MRSTKQRSGMIASLFVLILVGVCYLAMGTAGSAPRDRCVQPPSGMISWWSGDGDANDLIAGNHGTLENGATFDAGIVDQAFSLDGANDFIATEDVDLPATFTIDAWIYPNDLGGAPMIVNKDDDFSRSYYLAIDNYGMLVASVMNINGEFTQYRTNDVALTPSEWQHVVMTYDGSLGSGEKMKFYVNGLNFPASPLGSYDAGGTPNNVDLVVRLGIYGDEFRGPFNGLLDEIELFNRVLTMAEIAALHDAGSAGKCKTVTICHKPGTPAEQTLAVPRQAVAGHLRHGDTKGACK